MRAITNRAASCSSYLVLVAAGLAASGFSCAAAKPDAKPGRGAQTEALPAGTPASGSPAAVLCAGILPVDRETCREVCNEWPANANCLLLRRFGAKGLLALLEAAESDADLADTALQLGLPPVAVQYLVLYADGLGLRARAWAASPPPTEVQAKTAAEAKLVYAEAITAFRQGDFHRAEPLFRQVLELQEKAYGAERLETAKSLSDLAMVLNNLGQYEEARKLNEQALVIRGKVLDRRHPALAVNFNNIAYSLEKMGQVEDARANYRQALEIDESVYGPEHPEILVDLNNLALLLRDAGQYAEAKPLFERALVIREKTMGPEHPDVAKSLYNLAEVEKKLGNVARAKELYKRASRILKKNSK